MEGISGIGSKDVEMTIPGKKQWEEDGKKYLTNDVLTVVTACYDTYDEIFISDCHNGGRNIDRMMFLGDKIKFIDYYWTEKITYHHAILVGFHGRKYIDDTKNAIFPHTFRDDIGMIKVNNVAIGEVGLSILWLHEHNVKTLLVIGDNNAVGEAKEIERTINGCIVKDKYYNEEIVPSNYFSQNNIYKSVKNSINHSDSVSDSFYLPSNNQIVLHSTYENGFKELPRYIVSISAKNYGDHLCWDNVSFKEFFDILLNLCYFMHDIMCDLRIKETVHKI